jgi:uncharacterized membrane protein YsdA (DUF1294 family)
LKIKIFLLCYLAFTAIISVITFCVYGWDKRQAQKDNWRTPESRLHLLAFAGGWPGAMFGQRFFRHKTQKLSFKLLTWLAAVTQLAFLVVVIYFWLNGAQAISPS